MEAARVVVEEAAVRAVELVDAVRAVLGGVRVHDVEQHHQPQTVRRVYQLLQLLGGSVPTARQFTVNRAGLHRGRVRNVQ